MSKAGNKPTPPPLDGEQAIAAAGSTSGAPLAESGKVTSAEDANAVARDDVAAQRAALEAERVELQRELDELARRREDLRRQRESVGRAREAVETDPATALRSAAAAVDTAAGRPPGQVLAEPRALLSDSSGQLVARPDPMAPPNETTVVVISNWYGHVDGKAVHIKHGTPFSDLPPSVQRAVQNTRGQRVGPLPPKLPPNPFTP